MLPKRTYETIRWFIAIVLPAFGLLIVTLESIWGVDMQAQECSLTCDALGLFLGTVFGVSKVVNDKKTKGK